jgi:hypothetical protein
MTDFDIAIAGKVTLIRNDRPARKETDKWTLYRPC